MEVLLNALEKTTSSDPAELRFIDGFLRQASSNNYPEFVLHLSSVLCNSEASDVARFQAAIQIKNSIRSTDPSTRRSNLDRWRALPDALKQQVRRNCLAALGTERRRPSQAAQCIGAIACCDFPIKAWPDLIPQLSTNILKVDTSEALRISSLESIGYVCQDLDDSAINPEDSNKVLTAIVHGMRAGETSDDVKLAAANAMLNSLEFCQRNFEVDRERHYIMQVICECTQSQNVKIRVVSLQILVKVVSLYYVYLASYMERALFAITMDAMQSPVDEIALQGIEFWSTLCEEELVMMLNASTSDQPLKASSSQYAEKGCAYLLPTLLERLKHTAEEISDDDWNPAKAASVCLLLLSECVDNKVVQPVVQFVQTNLGSSAWNYREAAIIAFGSIMIGLNADILVEYVSDALPVLLGIAVQDPSEAVRDTTLWTIGRICDSVHTVALSDTFLPQIVQVLTSAVEEQSPRVAYNACWALGSLSETAFRLALESEGLPTDGTPTSYRLSSVIAPIIEHLIRATDRPDANDHNLYYAAYETISAIVRFSPKDCNPIIAKLYELMVQRLYRTVDPASASADGNAEVQGVICATLQAILLKIDFVQAERASSQLIACLLAIIGTKDSSAAHEDAITTISALCDNMTTLFVEHIDKILNVVTSSISRTDSKQIQLAAVGLFSDICRISIQSPNLSFCESCVPIILSQLSNEKINREVKSQMLSSIGDVALCMGIHYTKFLEQTMQVLTQAMVISLSQSNSAAQSEYNESLLDNCLLALAGILNGVLEPAVNPSNSHDPVYEQVYSIATQYTVFMIDYIEAVLSRDDINVSTSSQSVILGTLIDILSSNLMQARAHLNSKKSIHHYAERLAIMTEAPKVQRMADWIRQHLRFSNMQTHTAYQDSMRPTSGGTPYQSNQFNLPAVVPNVQSNTGVLDLSGSTENTAMLHTSHQ